MCVHVNGREGARINLTSNNKPVSISVCWYWHFKWVDGLFMVAEGPKATFPELVRFMYLYACPAPESHQNIRRSYVIHPRSSMVDPLAKSVHFGQWNLEQRNQSAEIQIFQNLRTKFVFRNSWPSEGSWPAAISSAVSLLLLFLTINIHDRNEVKICGNMTSFKDKFVTR